MWDYRDQATVSMNSKCSKDMIVFIPGHMGDYKQVRSIGSALLRRKQHRVIAFDFSEAPGAAMPCSLLAQEKYVETSVLGMVDKYIAQQHYGCQQ